MMPPPPCFTMGSGCSKCSVDFLSGIAFCTLNFCFGVISPEHLLLHACCVHYMTCGELEMGWSHVGQEMLKVSDNVLRPNASLSFSTTSLPCQVSSLLFMILFVHEYFVANRQGLHRAAGFKLRLNDTQVDVYRQFVALDSFIGIRV